MNIAIKKAEAMGFTMQKLLAIHIKIGFTMQDGWSELAYNNLEDIRKMARDENQWFEELLILMSEVEYLLKFHPDFDLIYAVNSRLKELYNVFDMPDDVFRDKFNESYINGKAQKIKKQTIDFLVRLYDTFYVYSDFMAGHMNFLSSLLCCKAMGKIEMLTGRIAFRDRMERLFKQGVDYGNIREFDKAMSHYNDAIRLARDENDATYEYLGLVRKLSICLVSRHMDRHIDFDSEMMSAVVGLYEMCGGNYPNPYSLGAQLIESEKKKAEKGGKAEAKEANWRIARLGEAMPILHLLFSLSRGDWQSACLYAEELKEMEMAAYGACSGLSSSDLIIPMYAMLYNSVERDDATDLEAVEKDDEEEVGEEDDANAYYVDFPAESLPVDRYRKLLDLMRKKMSSRQQNAAKALGEQSGMIALAVCSDYNLAMSLFLIGKSYESVDKVEEALIFYNSVLRMCTECDCPGSDITLSNYLLYTTLYEIGKLTKHTNPTESIRVLTKAIGLLDDKKHDERFMLENCLLARAVANGNVGDIAGKEADCKAALDLIVGEVKRRLPFVDKELRENYWAEVSELLRRIVAQVEEGSTPSFRRDVYDAVLMSKGFLLSSERAEKEAIYNEESLREYIPLHKELEEYEASKLPWGTVTENSAGKYVEHYMKSMKLQMATKDVIGKYFDFMHTRFEDIASALNENDVVLDYYDYPLEDDDQQYVAFVYRKGDEAPDFVKVCKESDLQKVYQEVAANKYDDGTPFHISEAYNANFKYSAQLKDLILGGVLNRVELPQNSRIYFAPSGSLYKIPVESLVVEVGTATIVSDFYSNFSRISHARTILGSDDSDFSGVGLFGGLKYGGDDADVADMRGYRIAVDDSAPTPLARWGELKQTLSEVNNISFLWDMTKGKNAELFTGFDGTPEKFKELSERGCSVLHLATHGFFETKRSKVNIPVLQGAYNPMDLTGIVMSNGNEGWMHGDNLHHEGILTATDISKIDLSQAKLVVLSACYTGDGVVRSDGVFGLQRAFKKAGAGSLIMSLWNESDVVGSQFMFVFYSHLLSENIDKGMAFKLAKAEIRKRFPHPLFWANFIMID